MTSRKDPIPADHFFSADLRVGRVLAVEAFPQARKPAYRIQVDFGAAGTLWTSAQVTNYAPQELKDRLVVGVINLPAKRIAGRPSEFLLLGSYTEDGLVHLLSPEQTATPGDVIG